MQTAGADMLHIDVMDGHFVPNITVGAVVARSLKKSVSLPLDVHLMISRPADYIDDFDCADFITVHLESEGDTQTTLQKIKSRGIKAGLSVKPNTDISLIFPYLKLLDLVLVMSVEPGFGGQGFLTEALNKIKALHKEINAQGVSTIISVDGGINENTAAQAAGAGANCLVSGSCLFTARDPAKIIKTWKNL